MTGVAWIPMAALALGVSAGVMSLRHAACQSDGVGVASLAAACPSGTATHTLSDTQNLNPKLVTLRPPGPRGRVWKIAYLPEGFTDVEVFNTAVATFLTNVENDSAFFKSRIGAFAFVSVPLKSKDGHLATYGNTADTALALPVNGRRQCCNYDLTEDFSLQVGRHVQNIPDLTSIVVVARQNMTDSGCAFGDLLVLSSSAKPGTVLHEFGHIIGGLFDERDGLALYAADEPEIAGPNCSSQPNRPSWARIKGCDGFDNLYRSTDTCRMRQALATPFCAVCEAALDSALKRHNAKADDARQQYIQLIVRLTERANKWRGLVVGSGKFRGSPTLPVAVRGDFVLGLDARQEATSDVRQDVKQGVILRDDAGAAPAAPASAAGAAAAANEEDSPLDICLAAPAQSGLTGRSYGPQTAGLHDAPTTDGLIAIFRCPPGAFPNGDPPPPKTEYSFSAYTLARGTVEDVTPQTLKNWLTLKLHGATRW